MVLAERGCGYATKLSRRRYVTGLAVGSTVTRMDWTSTGSDLLNDPGDLRNAEARLTRLDFGSRDYALLAEVVDRLSADVKQVVRSQTRRAALRDAAALSQCRAKGYRSAYHGPLRPEYRVFLAGYVTALGGSLEDEPDGHLVVFSGHRISVRYSPAKPHVELKRDGAEHLHEVNVALRAAFVDGAEARSRADRGRALTGPELERVLERYRGDVEAE